MKDIFGTNTYYAQPTFALPHHQTLTKSRKIQKVMFSDPATQLATSLIRRNALGLKVMRLNELKKKEQLLRYFLAQTVMQMQQLE